MPNPDGRGNGPGGSQRTIDFGNSREALIIGVFGLLLGLVRWVRPPSGIDETGLGPAIDSILTLALFVLVFALSMGVGRRIVARVVPEGENDPETVIISALIGLGAVGYAIFGLGMLGLLSTLAMGAILILAYLVALPALPGMAAWAWRALHRTPRPDDLSHRWGRILRALLILVSLSVLVMALAPPWSYDALMYHLQAPKEFLGAGAIRLLPENWPANDPLTPQMLYLLGIGLGTDVFARLVNLGFAILLAAGLWFFSARRASPWVAWLAVGILVGTPIFPFWGSLAYADMAWAAFELMALVSLINWLEGQGRGWLWLSGILGGLAMGSKYLGLAGVAALGATLLVWSRRGSLRRLVAAGAQFGFTALAVASPWYLKNLVLAGNPFYPLFFGGPGWPPERLRYLVNYHLTFGTGRSPLDYIALPFNIYLQHERFVTFLGTIEIPSFLFIFSPLYPLTKGRNQPLNVVATFALFRFLTWAIGVQQVRHLLPAFPALSLLAAWVLVQLAGRLRFPSLRHALPAGLVLGMLVASLIYLFGFVLQTRPDLVVIGAESRDTYLRRVVDDYAAQRFILEHVPRGERVMMMWDARGYYCDERCVPDGDHRGWARLVEGEPDPLAVAAQLKEQGVTHLLFNLPSADFALLHDPGNGNQRALDFFANQFAPRCAQKLFDGENTSVWRITCR
jgi:hypothetical protein